MSDKNFIYLSGIWEYVLEYKKVLKVPGKKAAFISMSRGGNPYDNAVMEAFNKSLKSELIDKKHPFETGDLARKEVFEYIEMFYNPKRLHSALGYKSQVEFERMHFNSSIYSMCPINGGQSGILPCLFCSY